MTLLLCDHRSCIERGKWLVFLSCIERLNLRKERELHFLRVVIFRIQNWKGTSTECIKVSPQNLFASVIKRRRDQMGSNRSVLVHHYNLRSGLTASLAHVCSLSPISGNNYLFLQSLSISVFFSKRT